jgi:hypothetical protein
MLTYQASTSINALAERIWEILADAGGYPDWDPGIDHIEGTIALGEKVKFFTKLQPNQAFSVQVNTFEPGKRMVFTGGMPLGLFKSERTHMLTPRDDGSISFHTREIFEGLLLPLFRNNIPDLTENFKNFCTGLKSHAEKVEE